MKNDFVPHGNANNDSFQENLLDKIDAYIPVLGLDPAQVNATKSILNDNRIAFSVMVSKKTAAKASVEDYYNSRKKATAEVRRLAKQIKSSKVYTTGIGDDLGIIGPEAAAKVSVALKPVLKASVNGHEVMFRFRKEGTHGIKLYSRRGSETEFTFLAVSFASPYNDSREKQDPGKSEQREYYAYYYEKNVDIGQRSDVLKIVVP